MGAGFEDSASGFWIPGSCCPNCSALPHLLRDGAGGISYCAGPRNELPLCLS